MQSKSKNSGDKIRGRRRHAHLPQAQSNAATPHKKVIVISSDDEGEQLAGTSIKHQNSSRGGHSMPRRTNQRGTGPAAPKRRPYLLIDLTASEDLIDDSDDPFEPAKKRQRLDTEKRAAINPIIVLDSDDERQESDSDYENLHGGYDIGWSSYVSEQDDHLFDLDVDLVEEAVKRLHLGPIDYRIPHNSQKFAPLAAIDGANCNREIELRYKGLSSFRRIMPPRIRGPVYASYCGGRARTGYLKHRPPKLESPLNSLKLSSRFRMADSSQSITQSSDKILIASSTPGGTVENEQNNHYRVDPYNSGNTLALWTEETRERWLQAHCALSPYNKYYDITCARFDPTNTDMFVTTGRDCSLVIWNNMATHKFQSLITTSSDDAFWQEDKPTRYMPVRQWGKEIYGGFCHDIVFRQPDRLGDPMLFAAPCDNGTIFLHSYAPGGGGTFSINCLRLSSRKSDKPGAVLWGQRSTSNILFACSENDDAVHGAFDVTSGRFLYRFDQRESGEEIVLDPEGCKLALLTFDDELGLHLYDVSRADKRCVASTRLPPPSPQLAIDKCHEIGTAAWSPDGVLLALGCNDDVAHVYDVRCLERGPLLSLTHETRSSSRGVPVLSLPEDERAEAKGSFGITALSWTWEACFRSSNLGLLTGGGDHCVALWDIKTACKERHVVAELDDYVGVAHFGDLSKGEKPLVVGDIDGHIYIYDLVEKSSIC